MEISHDIRQAGARLFDVDGDTLHLLGGMDGVVYAYARNGRQYVLKFTPTQRARVPGMRAKLDFVKYLAAHGVSVAQPVPSIHGDLIEILDAPATGTEYAVSSSERAPGRTAFEAGEWGAELFEKWGQVLGQMHRLTKSYEIQRTWADGLIGNWEGEHYSFEKSCDDDEVRARWTALGDELRRFTLTPDCYGLIHNDMHPFNFMVSRVNGGLQLTLFDFDVCNYHWFMTDIGIALFHALWAKRRQGQPASEFAANFLADFMRGYDRENRLDDAWLRRLPLFLQYRQMLLYMVFSHEWDHPDPQQLAQLTEWRHNIVNAIPVVGL